MYSPNPFPHFIYTPPLIFGHERDHDIFLHHHNHELLTAGHFSPPNAPVPENFPVGFSNHDLYSSNGNPYPSDSFDLIPRKKIFVKKDRRHKICTAQGSRDRRVRLSIEIARKFFDLQDMLGFDKASKTLDWLLTKSKTAIEELKLSCSDSTGGTKSLSSNFECEVLSTGTNSVKPGENSKTKKNKKPLISSVIKNISKQQQSSAYCDLLARESRAEARARARERTREKMRIRKLDELKNVNRSASWNQIETREKLGSYVSSNKNYSLNICENWDVGTSIRVNQSAGIMLKQVPTYLNSLLDVSDFSILP